jgi:bifunctional non-homologous end joining protein LigD
MALEEYKRKRDFTITSEPPAKVNRSNDRPIFVVQEHHATKLHYDFRLESDGVLKSWAVTKEPTLDPSIKRLAVEVEDHPIAYAKFHGEIPEGEYGAGHVEIWDSGTYDNLQSDGGSLRDGIEAGKLEFALHGEKLHGAFTMIRMKGDDRRNNWLLIKKKDDAARPGSAKEQGGSASKISRGKKPADRAPAISKSSKSKPKWIEFSNEGKIMFPELGVTKGEVLEYYERIAEYLLPHLKDRPITLERLPEGLIEGAPHFWQKNTPSYYPDWIPRAELTSERGDPVNYVLVNDVQTLLYLVNQGTITFHVWASRMKNLDRPDFVLFDLDPGQSTFQEAVTVAKQLHTMLGKEKIESFVKTSGKSGLHVLVPWTDRGDDEVARGWAMEFAGRVVAELPEIVTVERSKSERQGKLYLDVLQNIRGHHAVPPYVLRAVPKATVSTPLRWNELTADLTPAKFDIRTIFRRLSRMKNDPIAPLAKYYGRRKR